MLRDFLRACGLVVVCSLTILPQTAGAAETGDAPSAIDQAVVKVYSTVRYPDPFKPWTKQAPSEISGSGVVIEGHRILTNAHVVLYASQVQIEGSQAGDKISASVVAIAPGIDLALLKLDDESFFDSHLPVPRESRLPAIKDAVLAYGFPKGGASLSITKGIVSRIEFAPYNGQTSGLRIQIDAAINPGNSGGPAIAGDRMIGLAFSKLGGDAQSIGYIIPSEEIDLFLKDVADGHYDGKPALFDEIQTLENPALRGYLKLDKSAEGVIVHRPARADASYPLKEWDLITQIAGNAIDDQGKVQLGPELRVSFRYLIQRLARDGKLPLTIVRGGKTLQVQVPVVADQPRLIADLRGDYPPYFIYGPLVFSKATLPFLSFLGNRDTMAAFAFLRSPLVNQMGDQPDSEREELVVVSSPFFPHKLAVGYANPSGCVVASVNGRHVKSLAQLVAILRDLRDDYVSFEFDNRSGEAMVFPRAEMLNATDDILTDNGVRARGSADMLAIWNGR